MFNDRHQAGRELAARCGRLAGDDVVVLGLPRGGVPVAAEVAHALHAPLDVCVVRKLGVPYRPELGMGAIGEGGTRVINEEIVEGAGVRAADLAAVEDAERDVLRQRARRYRGDSPPAPLTGRTAVVVDDGVATGSTARAACRIVRERGARRVVLAVPVAPADWTERLAGAAEEFISVETPAYFAAIGEFYRDFTQTPDEEVTACLTEAARERAAADPPPPPAPRDPAAYPVDPETRAGPAAPDGRAYPVDPEAPGGPADPAHPAGPAAPHPGGREPRVAGPAGEGPGAAHPGGREPVDTGPERPGRGADGPVRREAGIPAAGGVLPGELTVPAGAGGIVVFAHGSGSSRHSPRNRGVADALAAAGLGTLLFDLLTEDEARDRANVFDIALLAGRRALAAAWLRTQPEAEGRALGCFGASTGAGAALWAAAEPSCEVAAVVSRGGRPDLAGDRLPLVKAPTLLIVGGRDHEVLDLNRRAQRELRCENDLAVVPGATHLFAEPGALTEVSALAAAWFTRHLAPASRSAG